MSSSALPQVDSASSRIIVTSAVPADAPAISRLGVETFSRVFGHAMPATVLSSYLAENYSAAAIEQDISAAAADRHVFVARRVASESTAGAPTSASVSTEGRGVGDGGNNSRAQENEENGDTILGFALMKTGTTETCIPDDVAVVELNRIYVGFEHLGSGVGQKLMDVVLEWAKERLMTRPGEMKGETGKRMGVWLGVWENHPPAQRFYLRNGFEKIGSHPFPLGGMTHTDWVMLKML